MKRLVLVLCVWLASLEVAAAAERYKIMIATWRGCEEACEGFKQGLKDQGMAVDYVMRDAGQKEDAVAAFVADARQEKVDLILTWGTNVTRRMLGTLAQLQDPAFVHDTPAVFTIVADPVGAGLIQSLERTGRSNVTGTFNRVPEEVNIETIKSYLPGFKRIGLLFHTNEKNSVLKKNELERLAKSSGFALTALELPLGTDGKPKVQDIDAAMRDLKAAGANFLNIGSSSFLRAHGDAIAAAAVKYGIPVFTPYEKQVHDSEALISVAPRYTDVGRLAAVQARKILIDGKAAGSLPVAQMKDFAVVINLAMAKKLKLFPPLGLLELAETVNR